MNVMAAIVKNAGQETVVYLEGTSFEHNGIALHIRKEGTLWLISLHNSGIITRGIATTIKKAVQIFDAEEGSVIGGWLYDRHGADRLNDLEKLYQEFNTEQIITKTYDPETGRLIIGKEVKAGDLI